MIYKKKIKIKKSYRKNIVELTQLQMICYRIEIVAPLQKTNNVKLICCCCTSLHIF